MILGSYNNLATIRGCCLLEIILTRHQTGLISVAKIICYKSLLITEIIMLCSTNNHLHFNFHSLEVVDRVSETQLQVGENST